MSKRGSKKTWLGLVLLGIGLIPLAIMGLWGYMAATATSLHPHPNEVPSVKDTPAPPQWADAVEQGRQVVRTALSQRNLPGLSVAVGVNGDIVWAEGFGWADLDKHSPVSPHTRFRIGNASTVLTSAAAGVLLEKGTLKLDDDIQTYVPEFPKKQWPVTLRNLMGHTAGLRSDGGDEGPLFSQHCERPVEALRQFADRSLRFEPGTQYQFSNYSWIVVSTAIESAADEPFLTFIQQQVFAPLGMRDTLAESATKSIPDRATPYFPQFAANPHYGLDPMRPLDYSCYAGSSVFLSTPSDLARFAMAINSGKLLQPATVKLLQTSQRLPSGQETGYGLGWDLETVPLSGKPTRVIGHDGDLLGGNVASLMTFPEQGIVVAVVSNTSYADTPAVAVKIAQAFAEHTPTPVRK